MKPEVYGPDRPTLGQFIRDCPSAIRDYHVQDEKHAAISHSRELTEAFDEWMRYFEFDPNAAEFFFNLDFESLDLRH